VTTLRGRSWRCCVRIMGSIFKVDGPGNVVTILMSKGPASTSDTFVTKPSTTASRCCGAKMQC